ncbi:MlaA family lipoprotein [Azospirillum agricola]|uniref:MlaA family lipoprotein n=1 Tax=Azospirillum agricola TaxID=1720247 RepID=UPI000A0F13D2|nr:VacJ family lipoprotein [Azospirillum agricola]SMH60522.1 phospholipid-binding lipoprotein MlaA [Azospirillum lipoferum]
MMAVRALGLAAPLLVPLAAGLMAARPAAALDLTTFDPWEGYNRAVFAFNNGFNSSALEPLRQTYASGLSAGTRAGISNVFANLREPWTAISSTLRADFPNAGTSAGRFLVNTTVGLGGWYDVAASRFALKSRQDDLGNVLCHWGLTPGPYMVLPFLGPTTGRDLLGRSATMVGTYSALGLSTYMVYRTGDGMVRYLDDGFIEGFVGNPNLDAYALERGLYTRIREAQCAGVATSGAPYGGDQQ